MINVTYHYDGILDEHTARGCHDMLQDYPFAIEVKELPDYSVFQSLKQRTYRVNGDWYSGSYERTGTLYGTHWRGSPDNGFFIFLKDEDDRDRVLAAIPTDKLISARPFRGTTISGR